MAAAAQLLHKPTLVAGDCLGTVKAMKEERVNGLECVGKLMYEGVIASTRDYDDTAPNITDVLWIKAHQRTDEEDISDALREHRKGNAEADEHAKAACRKDTCKVEEQVDLTEYLEAKRVLEVMRATLPLFPKLQRSTGRRQLREARARTPGLMLEHRWQWAGGLWRCAECATYAYGGQGQRPSTENLLQRSRVPEPGQGSCSAGGTRW